MNVLALGHGVRCAVVAALGLRAVGEVVRQAALETVPYVFHKGDKLAVAAAKALLDDRSKQASTGNCKNRITRPAA